MHVPFELLPIFVSLLLGAFAVAEAHSPAMPRAAHAPHNALRQITRAELTARKAHPELFRKRDDGIPSNPSDPSPCDFTLPSRKRGEVVEQVLTAREMAAFLMGRGTFTSSNGTAYTDEIYAGKLREATISKPGYYHRVYNVVKDTLGNKLLEVSIPHYKKWKSTLMHGDLVYLSPSTGIRAQDIDELERLLVADDNFKDIQVHGFRISRKFFEVATSF